ncbi:MAG: DUF2177 family protein [Bacillota bacterium]
MMLVFFQSYIIAIVIFFIIDMLWLGLIAKNLYQKYIGNLLKTDVNWIAALSFYFLFVAGLVFFVIMPALEKNSAGYALLVGGLFGLITYATYDLTNLATMKSWPLEITVIDLAWGTFLGASTSVLSYFLIQILF